MKGLLLFLESNKLAINYLNSISEFNFECTFIVILVKKIKVQAIVDFGAPINIICIKLVKKPGIHPNIVHYKEYGTIGLHITVLKEAYSALP